MLAVLAADDFLNLAGNLMTGVLVGAGADGFPDSTLLEADADLRYDGLLCSSSAAATRLSLSHCRPLRTLTARNSRLLRSKEAWYSSELVSACHTACLNKPVVVTDYELSVCKVTHTHMNAALLLHLRVQSTYYLTSFNKPVSCINRPCIA